MQEKIWLGLAKCYSELGEIEEAAWAYENVLEIAPLHLESRIALSNLQLRLGRSEDAMATLNYQNDLLVGSEEDRRIYYQRCLMLDTSEHTQEFIMESAKLLFAELMAAIKSDADQGWCLS